jgi:hypothetical protein
VFRFEKPKMIALEKRIFSHERWVFSRELFCFGKSLIVNETNTTPCSLVQSVPDCLQSSQSSPMKTRSHRAESDDEAENQPEDRRPVRMGDWFSPNLVAATARPKRRLLTGRGSESGSSLDGCGHPAAEAEEASVDRRDPSLDAVVVERMAALARA